MLWLVMFLGTLSLFMIQVEQRLENYLNYETNVDVELMFPTAIPFPVVTICNQNNYR